MVGEACSAHGDEPPLWKKKVGTQVRLSLKFETHTHRYTYRHKHLTPHFFSQISEDHLCTYVGAEIRVTVYFSLLFPAYIVRAHTQLTLHTLLMMLPLHGDQVLYMLRSLFIYFKSHIFLFFYA